jgi:hypothetical protein
LEFLWISLSFEFEMKRVHKAGDAPISEFSKLGISPPKRYLKCEDEDSNKKGKIMMDVLRTRLLSIAAGVLMWLVVEERENIVQKYRNAFDALDLVRLFLFVTYLLSLASISQLLADIVALLFRGMGSRVGFLKRGGRDGYLYGVMQGCAGLYGYFMAKLGSGMWKDLEEKSSCLVRWRGSTHGGPPCEYHILRITLGLEKRYCELASPVCSKLVFLGPYMLIGGLLTVIGVLVAMEYLGFHDVTCNGETCFFESDGKGPQSLRKRE